MSASASINPGDPRQAKAFRFVRAAYAQGEAQLVYAFDKGPELIERIAFPDAPSLAPERQTAFDAALRLLHLIAGVSYYKAGVPGEIVVEGAPLDTATAALLDELYLHGLAEFAYQNKLELRGRISFLPPSGEGGRAASAARPDEGSELVQGPSVELTSVRHPASPSAADAA